MLDEDRGGFNMHNAIAKGKDSFLWKQLAKFWFKFVECVHWQWGVGLITSSGSIAGCNMGSN